MYRVLMIAQSINQSYINQISEALGNDSYLDIISGNHVCGNNIGWIRSPEHNPKSFFSRLKCWGLHFIFIIKWVKQQHDNYNLIVAVSNPPINAYIGLKLKKRFKAPFVYVNWDLYPQIIEASIKSPISRIICFFWRRWNTKNYPKIDHMITIGPQMAKSIIEVTKAKINLSVIPLGVDSSLLIPIKKEYNSFLVENNLSDKFIVLFSGKMGMGHNLDIILKAAERLRSFKEIVFVLIGGGPKYKIIDEYIEKNEPLNVRLYPWQDSNMFPYSIACGDVAIVTEEKSAEGLMLPSRVFSMMSCGEAIIGVCGRKDDLFSLVEDNKIGKCITDDNFGKLCTYITELYHDRSLLEEMKRKARQMVEEKYSVSKSTIEYKKIFDGLKGK